MTAIIILNWNGADDTIACLQSLAKAEGEFVVYVVDNGSADDSLARIQSWMDGHADTEQINVGQDCICVRHNLKPLRITKYKLNCIFVLSQKLVFDILIFEFAHAVKYHILTSSIFTKNIVTCDELIRHTLCLNRGS